MEPNPLQTNCDKEQIQYIQTIQPFGSLIGIDPSGKIAVVAAESALQIRPENLLGIPIEQFLGHDTNRIIESVAGRSEPSTVQVVKPQGLGQWVSCIAHTSGENTILELERVFSDRADIPSVKFMIKRDDNLAEYLSYLAENIRAATGCDRVMIYKFWEDWHGEVVAEAKDASVPSFYQHHFPASDIPEPARRLFTLNWVRMIPNVDAEPIAISMAPDFSGQLDLTRSTLRSAASIHLEYLRNMEVKASFTLSLIANGRLWGLIACHNFSPKYLSAEHRGVCALIAKVASSRITSLEVQKAIGSHERLTQLSSRLGAELQRTPLLECIKDNKRRLLEYISADGFVFSAGDEIVTEGNAPTTDQIRCIIDELEKSGQSFVHTSRLANLFPSLSSLSYVAAGLVAIKIENDWAIWTKCEMLKTLFWAGDPTKQAYQANGELKFSPRKSFESWKEAVSGVAIPWESPELEAFGRLQQMLSDVVAGLHQGVPALGLGSYADRLEKSIDQEIEMYKKRRVIPQTVEIEYSPN